MWPPSKRDTDAASGAVFAGAAGVAVGNGVTPMKSAALLATTNSTPSTVMGRNGHNSNGHKWNGVTPIRSTATSSSTPGTVVDGRPRDNRDNSNGHLEINGFKAPAASPKLKILICDQHCPYEEAVALARDSDMIPVSFVWALDSVSRFSLVDFDDPRFEYRRDTKKGPLIQEYDSDE
jgi:hypothetical protein